MTLRLLERVSAGSPRKSVAQGAAVLMLVASLALLAAALNQNAAHRDFICYWSSGRLLVNHQNPYSTAAILKLENRAGDDYRQALIMRNPPWGLPLVALLGWLSAPHAALLWELGLILATLLSLRLLRPFTGGSTALMAYVFAPLLACVMAGQLSLLLLLGFCVFLRLEKERPFAAGLALAVTLLKPHLFLLVWPVLLLEGKRGRRILGGALTGVAGSTAVGMALDPQAWGQYLQAMRSEHIQTQFLPNPACVFRILVDSHAFWLQFAPAIAGIGVALWMRRRMGSRWQWSRQGAMLLAVSVLVSPYSWLVDEVLILPAVLMAYRTASKPARIALFALNSAELVAILRFPELSSPAHVWTAMAWVAWCWTTAQGSRLRAVRKPVSPERVKESLVA